MISMTELNTGIHADVDLIDEVMNDGAYRQKIYDFRAASMDPSPRTASLAGRGTARTILRRAGSDCPTLETSMT